MSQTTESPDISLSEMLEILAEEKDFDLRGYKNSTLQRRIHKRMGQLGIDSYAAYLKRFNEQAAERNQLLNTVLINVTEFFRDPMAWEAFGREALYPMLKDQDAGCPLRAWVAGCSTGEEVYSLAIMLAEYYGARVLDYPIKIYATDIDEEALAVARRGEYPADRMRGLTPELRAKYFSGDSVLRVARELRKMAIFGRSDLIHDAPISHVDMILCRNVLIYFDGATQKKIFHRLHYALEENGILLLGKAESKLSESALFESVDPRWRIFRKAVSQDPKAMKTRNSPSPDDQSGYLEELSLLRLYHRSLLDTLDPGVVVLNEDDVIVTDNDSALTLWGLAGAKLAGKPMRDTALATRCPDLASRVEESKRNKSTVQFECAAQVNGSLRNLRITVRPILGDDGNRAGSILYTEDVSHKEQLQSTVEQLESTGEELQSANEELETTNEELQSTNEELETTNEELQSTNEELETTNEELQSLNEELENMNEELEHRTRELDSLNSRYAATLEQMPWPVTLVDNNERILFWNSASQELFGLTGTSVIGLSLSQLPIDNNLRKSLVRRHATVVERMKPVSIKEQAFKGSRFGDAFDIHFMPVSRAGTPQSVLIMFGPLRMAQGAAKKISNNGKARTNSTGAKKEAKSIGSRAKVKKMITAKGNARAGRSGVRRKR
ncbi:MAG: Chemotaxis protein methyltransferase CheR [Acidobacteriaceae bacterium]|nr:Chemotaxis protein methyltransferase CheR [Acidobacteriaceae bacterium]